MAQTFVDFSTYKLKACLHFLWLTTEPFLPSLAA